MAVGVVVGDLMAGAEAGWRGREAGNKRSGAKSERKAAGESARPTTGGTRMTGKRRGEIAEAAFMAKVAGLGMGVAKTWGDSDRYDFIVDAGKRLRRVQVKSAHREGKDGGYSVRLHDNSLNPYRGEDIDALVAYVVPEDAWYVFPAAVFGRLRSMKLFPGSRKKRSRFEPYREAWEILRRRRGSGGGAD